MLQEIAPKKLYNEYTPTAPKEGDIFLAFDDRQVLVRGESPFHETGNLTEDDKKSLLYLFKIDDKAVFLWDKNILPSIEGTSVSALRRYWFDDSDERLVTLYTAYHLYKWYRENKFCGRCGKSVSHDDKERMLRCECGNMIFPKIAPAVIVAVRDNNRLLLTKYANRGVSVWALIAGFCEIGETVEETVAREVMEEVGLKVKNIEYFASQPWGIDQNLLMGFYCDLDGDDRLTVDKEELATGEWFEREKIPVREDLSSLTATMIKYFAQGRDKEEYAAGKII